LKKFRNLPGKEVLTIKVPSDLDDVLRERAHRERKPISEVASGLLYKGLGQKPPWCEGECSPKPRRREPACSPA
jgi:hypothetical protein